MRIHVPMVTTLFLVSSPPISISHSFAPTFSMQIFIFQRRLDTKKGVFDNYISDVDWSFGILAVETFSRDSPHTPRPPKSLLAGYWEEDNFNLLNSIIANIHLLFFIQVVNCGDPGTPPNGVRYGDVFTYLSQVILECDPQYRLVGNLFRTCQADGTWSGSQPTCQGKNTKGAQRSFVTVNRQ